MGNRKENVGKLFGQTESMGLSFFQVKGTLRLVRGTVMLTNERIQGPGTLLKESRFENRMQRQRMMRRWAKKYSLHANVKFLRFVIIMDDPEVSGCIESIEK